MDTETNFVVTVGFMTKVDHQTTSKIWYPIVCTLSLVLLQHQVYSKNSVAQEQNTKSNNEKAGHKRGPNVEIQYKMVTITPYTPACEKAIRVQKRKTVYRKNGREWSTGKEVEIVQMNGKNSF